MIHELWTCRKRLSLEKREKERSKRDEKGPFWQTLTSMYLHVYFDLLTKQVECIKSGEKINEEHVFILPERQNWAKKLVITTKPLFANIYYSSFDE